MQPHILTEAMEPEVHRVAAAFHLTEWKVYWRNPGATFIRYSGLTPSGEQVTWPVDDSGVCFSIEVGPPNWGCKVTLSRNSTGEWRHWTLRTLHPEHNDLLARDLYCLGIKEAAILAELPPLSAHEKLELRLALPHHFWPPNWHDEICYQAITQ